jgi:hypothetical protein
MHYSREKYPKSEGGGVKYEYEMRPDATGKYKRNGKSRAFFANGQLEREGMYKDDERVGRWKFYNADGSFNREVDYGPGKVAAPATRPADSPRRAPTSRPSAPAAPPPAAAPAARPATPPASQPARR